MDAEAEVDFSQFTDQELKEELDAMQLALRAALDRPFDGPGERLPSKIEAIKAELERRNAKRP